MDDIPALVVAIATGALLVGAGYLMTVLARRGAAGTLRRNPLAGIRTALTMSSDEAWHAAHVAAAGHTLRAGRGGIVGGVLTAFDRDLPAAGCLRGHGMGVVLRGGGRYRAVAFGLDDRGSGPGATGRRGGRAARSVTRGRSLVLGQLQPAFLQ